MVKKLKQNKLKQKQKQKQKQSVKVSQNVKVILNDLKKKRVIKKKSTGASVSRKQPNISLNIINPYQQFLPQPLQAQPQPVKQSELNKSNPANPSILRTLGALNNQNTMIQNELRDLREFSKNQQESYNYLLSAQRETPENKIDKMLKNKKRIASSMNWNNIINNEKKTEEKIIKEEKDSPSIYPWINPYPNQPDPRFVSTRPQAQQNILSSWLRQARENIAQPQQEYQPQQYFSGIPEEYEDEDEEEEDDGEEYDRYIEGQSMMEEDKQSSLMNEAFKQELEAQKKEGAGVDEPMTVKGSKKINKIIKKQQMLKSIEESKEMEQEDERSNLMREAFKKQIEEGADEEPVKSKRGRKPGSKNRTAEEIQQEKRQKEQNRFIRSLYKKKQIKLKKEKK